MDERPLQVKAFPAYAAGPDALYLAMLAVTGMVSLGIATYIVWSILRLSAARRDDGANGTGAGLPTEWAWSAIPLLVSLSILVWSVWIFLGMLGPGPIGLPGW